MASPPISSQWVDGKMVGRYFNLITLRGWWQNEGDFYKIRVSLDASTADLRCNSELSQNYKEKRTVTRMASPFGF